ncbi:MAG: class II aldolase/adducin family protein [Chloroflexi bacterium]|nr:class II aldolase/adducin family protein [Chloroflexota bacterium]
MSGTQAIYLVPEQLLGTLTPEEFRHLKRRVVAANRAMGYWYQQSRRDCMSMTSGHVSARVPGTNTFVTKGRAPDRDLMTEVTLQKLVQIDIPTRSKVAGEMEVATMGEIELHACVYEARPDVVAVCHGHSDYVQLCSTFGLRLKAFSVDGLDLVANGYGFYDKPYMLASRETGVPMAEALGEHRVVLLKGHGAAVASTRGPEHCIMDLIDLEQVCKLNWLAFTAVGKDYERYAFDDATVTEHRRLQASMRERFATPGKDNVRDNCYYNAAMARTFREAVQG